MVPAVTNNGVAGPWLIDTLRRINAAWLREGKCDGRSAKHSAGHAEDQPKRSGDDRPATSNECQPFQLPLLAQP